MKAAAGPLRIWNDMTDNKRGMESERAKPSSLCLSLDHCLDVLDMIGLVGLQHLLGVLQGEPPPLSRRLLPLLLGVELLHVQHEDPSSVAFFLVFKLSKISAEGPSDSSFFSRFSNGGDGWVVGLEGLNFTAGNDPPSASHGGDQQDFLLLPRLDTDTGRPHLEPVRIVYARLYWLPFTNFVLAVIVTVGICPVDDRNCWTGIAHHLVVL